MRWRRERERARAETSGYPANRKFKFRETHVLARARAHVSVPLLLFGVFPSGPSAPTSFRSFGLCSLAAASDVTVASPRSATTRKSADFLRHRQASRFANPIWILERDGPRVLSWCREKVVPICKSTFALPDRRPSDDCLNKETGDRFTGIHIGRDCAVLARTRRGTAFTFFLPSGFSVWAKDALHRLIQFADHKWCNQIFYKIQFFIRQH